MENQYAYFSTYFECHWTIWKYLNCVPEFQDNGLFITVSNKSHLKTSQRLCRGSSKTLSIVLPFWIRQDKASTSFKICTFLFNLHSRKIFICADFQGKTKLSSRANSLFVRNLVHTTPCSDKKLHCAIALACLSFRWIKSEVCCWDVAVILES